LSPAHYTDTGFLGADRIFFPHTCRNWGCLVEYLVQLST